MTREAEEAVPQFPRGSDGHPPEPGLATDLARLARRMRTAPSPEAVEQAILRAALAEVGAAEHGGIAEAGPGGQLRTRVASDRTILELENLQSRLDEGPSSTSAREKITVRCDDLSSDSRWPLFAAAAVEAGLRSTLSLRLFVEQDTLGVLTLYSTRTHAFSTADESAGMLLCTHAALAMRGTAQETNLRVGIESRDVIGQAKGILMERYKIDAAEAFNLLVFASQNTHRKLRDIAADLARTGGLGVE